MNKYVADTPEHLAVVSGPLALAKELAPLISQEAGEAERQGRLTDSVANAMLEARLFSLLVPTALGGHDASLRAMYEVVEELSRADGAAGWCATIGTNTTAAMARGLAPEALLEVFGADGAVSGAGSLAPTAVSQAVEDGYRVSGRFAWASGSAHSKWYVVGSVEQGSSGPFLRLYVLPTAQCVRHETWNVMGLKGTGSVDLSLDAVFVPRHRCMDMPNSTHGQSVESADPRKGSLADNAAVAAAGIGAFATGIARRALDELIALAPQAKRLKAGGTLAQDAAVQLGLAQAEGALRSARQHVMGCLDEMERARLQGSSLN